MSLKIAGKEKKFYIIRRENCISKYPLPWATTVQKYKIIIIKSKHIHKYNNKYNVFLRWERGKVYIITQLQIQFFICNHRSAPQSLGGTITWSIQGVALTVDGRHFVAPSE